MGWEQQVELVPIASLTPHESNPRMGDVGAIAESIAMNGWYGACIVSRRGDDALVLVAGEHRWRALSALQADGYTTPDGDTVPYAQLNRVPPLGEVPIIVLDGLTLAQERKILLADNRANDQASYDDGALAALLTELAEADDLLGTLYDGDAIDQLLHDINSGYVPTEPGHSLPTDPIRTIVVVCTPEERDAATVTLQRACDALGLETHSEAALAIWESWASDHS